MQACCLDSGPPKGEKSLGEGKHFPPAFFNFALDSTARLLPWSPWQWNVSCLLCSRDVADIRGGSSGCQRLGQEKTCGKGRENRCAQLTFSIIWTYVREKARRMVGERYINGLPVLSMFGRIVWELAYGCSWFFSFLYSLSSIDIVLPWSSVVDPEGKMERQDGVPDQSWIRAASPFMSSLNSL